MPRQATGQVRYRNGRYYARVRVGKARPTIELPTCKNDEQARARTAVLADIAKRLGAEHADLVPRFLDKAAAATPEALKEVLALVGRVIAGTAVRATGTGAGLTIRQLGTMWTSGELHRAHPDHVKQKTEDSAYSDEKRLGKYIYPIAGDVLVTAFSLDDAERVMATLPTKGPGSETLSRRHVAQLMGRLMHLAVYPLKLLKASPIPRGWLPQKGADKARAFLYPDEDRALMRAADVPLCYRILYGVLHREGLRCGEALATTWRDVDLSRGFLTLDENKTDDPRAWTLDPGVRATLAWWRAQRPDDEPTDHVFVDEYGRAISDDHLAARFRAHLQAAGIDRPQLYQHDKRRRRIRLHDTRATFVTLALANGRTETWVADRTGHRSSQQIATYRRAARSVAEAGLGDLESLSLAIPEVEEDEGDPTGPATGPGSRAKLAELADALDSGSRPRGPASEPSDERGVPRPSEATPARPGPIGSAPGPVGDPVEAALAAALERASAAGEWSTVAALARELEARRVARDGSERGAARRSPGRRGPAAMARSGGRRQDCTLDKH